MKSKAPALLVAFLLFSVLAASAREGKIRKPAVAGLFYPGEKRELATLVDNYLKEAPLDPCSEEEIVAIIVPHAGYLYSGKVAAHAYKQIRGRKYSVVVLIGPSHSLGFEGVSLYGGDYYETPLGRVKVNKNLADALTRQDKAFRFFPQAHQKEHSLEVQLPFLQRSLADFTLLPLVMGSPSLSTSRALAQALVNILKGERPLLVASSDLSHYHPSPVAKRLDQAAIEAIQAVDAPALIDRMAAGSCELCGVGPVATILLAAEAMGAETVRILSYADSGKVSGDYSAVVGYLAAAISKERGERASPPPEGIEGLLTKAFPP